MTGHITIKAIQSYSPLSSIVGEEIVYAWGLYVDKDAASATTVLQPFLESQTSTWMMWESGTVQSPSLLVGPGGDLGFFGDTDLLYRRYRLNQRKYKRKLDSYNDSLVFVVQNGNASGTAQLGVNYFFRMLLLE